MPPGDETRSAGSTEPPGRRRGATVLTGVFLVAMGCWVAAAALMSNRGFDITDEGFYVLSYRWWDSNHLVFTGAQYLYGPVFDAVGHRIELLRLFRLATVVIVSTSFAIAAVGWLRSRSLLRGASTFAAGSAIACTGGMVYAWLPQSPGYDDVAALGAIGTAATILSMAARIERRRSIPAWLPATAGVLATLQLLARWPAVLVLAICAISAAVVLRPCGRRRAAVVLAWALAGLVGSAVLVQVSVVPLDQAWDGIRFVNQAAANEAESPLTRAASYLGQLAELGLASLLLGLPLVLASVTARIRASSPPRWIRAVVLTAGFGWLVAVVLAIGAWQGGRDHALRYSAALLALAIASVVAGGRRPVSTEVAVLPLLMLLPLAQAFGTSNPLWIVGANAFASWFVVVVWAAAGAARSRLANLVSVGSASLLPLLAASIAVTGILLHPYRSTPFGQSTEVVDGLGLRVDRTEAARYRALTSAFDRYSDGRAVPILALDTMPGLVYALGGRAAGEPWTGPGGRDRSAAALVEACRDQQVTPEHPPFLLYNRPPDHRDMAALATCGFRFPEDFVEIPLAGSFPDLRVWAPRRVASGRSQESRHPADQVP